MEAVIVTTFAEGEEEVIPLPEDFGFGDGVEVLIEREGDRIIISPLPAGEPSAHPSV
jgi:virulence-associated protein VagC